MLRRIRRAVAVGGGVTSAVMALTLIIKIPEVTMTQPYLALSIGSLIGLWVYKSR